MLKLYRADQKGRKTIPEKYNTFGITSKQLNSGDDPEPHFKYGWLKTITAHIHVKDPAEQFIYDTTQYLSFTADLNQAEIYLSTSKNLSFESCGKDDAGAYLFSLTIDEMKLTPLHNGIYAYSFPCNYNKIKTDPKFYSFVASLTSCEMCFYNPGYLHRILLIDAVTYLQNIAFDYQEAYNNASRDKEWLILPADPMIGMHGKGLQSRVPVADFWTVDFFKYL